MSDACRCGDVPVAAAASATERAPRGLWEISEIRFAALAGLLLAAGVGAGWAGAAAPLPLALQVGALLAGAWTFVPQTLARLARGRIGVGTLMTIAAVGAVALGEVGEAAALAFLYSIAEGLEEYSLARTRRGLRSLLDLVPSEVTVLRDGRARPLEPAQVAVGDVLVVRPGERIATDGTVRSGRSAVDTSAITGESMPTDVGPADEVLAGTINGTGALEVTVTSAVADSSLARIVAIVEAEQARAGAGQRLADTVARPLVPGVLLAALLVAGLGVLFGDPLVWTERALVVLVAASPCALAIAVPVTVVSAVGAASRFGVLVKGGAALEALGRVRTVALDKTGTLTRNHPVVTEVTTAAETTRAEVLELAAALESRSEHPLARAILARVPSPRPAVQVTATPGAGLEGWRDGHLLRLGRPGWIDPGVLAAQVERLQNAGATVVLVERDHKALGAVAVRDELRDEAPGMVAGLRRSGYRVVMLTGDNAATAAALGRDAGIDADAVHARLRPEDKAHRIAALRGTGTIAMVGDGVNDAPALAAADPGVAMGAMGTDVAIETADVALLGEDLRHLPQALAHARRARAIMWQNIALSLLIIVVLPVLALLGVLGLAAVVLIHELAEVLVIANGIRAGRARPALRGPEPTHRPLTRAAP